MSEARMDDSERLTWLEDQLWNGWTVQKTNYETGSYGYELIEPSGFVGYAAPTLREAIDKAGATA